MVEDLTQRKISHVNALFSNSGYEGTEGKEARERALELLDEQFDSAMRSVYGLEEPEEELDKENPFFAHAYDGLPPLEDDSATVRDVLDANA